MKEDQIETAHQSAQSEENESAPFGFVYDILNRQSERSSNSAEQQLVKGLLGGGALFGVDEFKFAGPGRPESSLPSDALPPATSPKPPALHRTIPEPPPSSEFDNAYAPGAMRVGGVTNLVSQAAEQDHAAKLVGDAITKAVAGVTLGASSISATEVASTIGARAAETLARSVAATGIGFGAAITASKIEAPKQDSADVSIGSAAGQALMKAAREAGIDLPEKNERRPYPKPVGRWEQ